MHMKSQMQYRVSFALTALGQLLVSFTAQLGVYFMLSRFNEVSGFSYQEVMLCFGVTLMAYSLAECFGRGFDTFPQMLGNGELDRALVRPRPIIFQVLASKMEFTRAGRMLQAAAVLCVAIPASGVAWTPGRALALALMAACGSAVFFGLFLVYAAFAFFTTQGLEFMNILTDGGREFGRYPFSVYGSGVLKFLTYAVPLALFQYYPLLYLLGREQGALHMLAPLLGLPFLLPCFAFFRFGLGRYKSTGS
jgi:ABC-2 type transport system permease protein